MEADALSKLSHKHGYAPCDEYPVSSCCPFILWIALVVDVPLQCPQGPPLNIDSVVVVVGLPVFRGLQI